MKFISKHLSTFIILFVLMFLFFTGFNGIFMITNAILSLAISILSNLTLLASYLFNMFVGVVIIFIALRLLKAWVNREE